MQDSLRDSLWIFGWHSLKADLALPWKLLRRYKYIHVYMYNAAVAAMMVTEKLIVMCR